MAKRMGFGFLVLLTAACMWTIGSAAEEPGQRVYDANCSQCHGAEGRGAKGPGLVPFEWSYERALELIREPVCEMPRIPASQVSDAEVAQIVTYLKSIQ